MRFTLLSGIGGGGSHHRFALMEEVGADHDDDDDRSVEIRVVIPSISAIPSYIPKLNVPCTVATSSKVQ